MSAIQSVPATTEGSSALDDFFENGTIGLHLVAGDGTILRANRADFEPLGYTADEYVGRHIAQFHADREAIEDILARLSRGERLDKYPARLRAKDGSIRHVQISSSVCFVDGEFVNTRCFTVDVTDKLVAEAALRAARERLAATYEGALAGIAEVNSGGRFVRVNEAFCSLTGYSRDELMERTIFDLTHPDDADKDRRSFARQVAGEIDRYETEKRYLAKGGRVVWIQVISSTVRNEDGGFGYGVRVILDITDRKDSERRQRLLLDELNHRVKNTLATVQSLAAQTVRSCTTAEEFSKRFEPRLIALSHAHDRLTRNQWEGANLRDIVEEELGAHAATAGRTSASGPDVTLPPRASLSISMALHELATNAAKHGSLSVPDGQIAVTWEIERDQADAPRAISIGWNESGGPPAEAPRETGFGSRLLRITAEELDGKMETCYAPDGLRWWLRFPFPKTGAERDFDLGQARWQRV
jgi:PAS domain S-box-containing protein